MNPAGPPKNPFLSGASSGGSGSFFAIDVSDPANPSIHRADKYQTGGISGGYSMWSPIIDVANENIYYRIHVNPKQSIRGIFGNQVTIYIRQSIDFPENYFCH